MESLASEAYVWSYVADVEGFLNRILIIPLKQLIYIISFLIFKFLTVRM